MRKQITEAQDLSRAIDRKLDAISVEWTATKHVLEDDIKQLKHDQGSLRTALLAILDELEKADKKLKGK